MGIYRSLVESLRQINTKNNTPPSTTSEYCSRSNVGDSLYCRRNYVNRRVNAKRRATAEKLSLLFHAKFASRTSSKLSTLIVTTLLLLVTLSETLTMGAAMAQQTHIARTIFLRPMRAVGADGRFVARSGIMKLCPPGGETFASAWQMACGMRKRKKRDTTQEEMSKNATQNSRDKKVEEEALQAVAGIAITEPEPLTKTGGVISLGSTRHKRNANNYYAYSNKNDNNGVSNHEYQPFAPKHSAGGLDTIVLSPKTNDNNREDNAELNLLADREKSKNSLKTTQSTVLNYGKTSKQLDGPLAHEIPSLLSELNGRDDFVDVDVDQHQQNAAAFRAPSISEMMTVCCTYGCSLRDLLPYCSPFGDWDSY